MVDKQSVSVQIANKLLHTESKKFSIITLGCRVNQAESQELHIALRAAGHISSGTLYDSDIVFVNTCAVTQEAEAKTRKTVRRAVRSGASLIVVMGCASEMVKKQMEGEIETSGPAVVFLNNESKLELIKLLAERTAQQQSSGSYPMPRTRAFVKIQDGCNQRCSYCVVPALRGNEYSVEKAEILRKLELLEMNGVKEIVLTGIHLGRYEFYECGRKYGLSDLLREITERFNFRVRLSSIDIFELDEELIETVSELRDRICPHFHIPLQSGSNRILRMMKRPYTVEYFLSRIAKIREKIGLVALSTDVMVGFPGETEEDFAKTVEAIQKAEFMKLHVFRFSKRPGTVASDMANQVDEITKRMREKVLLEMSENLGDSFRRKLDGLAANVLIERKKGNFYLGKTEYYADVKISSPVKIGEIYRVKINYDEGELFGEVLR